MKMSGIASATGLISARIRPIYRAKQQHVELSGYTKPAPFALRPYASLFNPYSYGCSVLCNHPMDNEAKDVVRRARDTWANEGKALLLPEEMEMIRTRLLAVGRGEGPTENSGYLDNKEINADAVAVPEELFRKYTETDSRPFTPAPTLASVHATIPYHTAAAENIPPTVIYNPRERTTLVLDLRANSQPQLDNGTFTWHSLTLEVLPVSKKTGIIANCKPISRRRSSMRPPFALSSLQLETCKTSLHKVADNDANVGSDGPTITRRRGKKLRKRNYRRGSIYGQQTEIRDPLEPPETQISQTGDGSRRASDHALAGDSSTVVSSEKNLITLTHQTMHASFIPAEILKHLCRELNRDKIEAEFSLKRKIAFEEAFRVKGEAHFALRATRQTSAIPSMQNIPRVFSRQAARFEILDSQSLCGITPLEYLSKYVHVSSGRKLIFGRAFIKFHEETLRCNRCISPSDIKEALQDVIGRTLTDDRHARLRSFLGEISEPLDFRTWCGVCAAAERLLCPLPLKETDPPEWLERLDFNTLEKRLASLNIDPRLARLLREIRDK